MSLPQLRVRTEFSFRSAFGPVSRVASALADLGAPGAGIVDEGTWGHVRWNKAVKKAGLRPFFGVELPSLGEGPKKPRAWALAACTKGFYQFTTAFRRPEADLESLLVESASSLVRFSGAALSDPSTFDYVDLNPSSPRANARALALAKRTKRPLVATSDNFRPKAEDLSVWLSIGGRERTTPQHILSDEELRASLGITSNAEWKRICANTIEAAERCATELPAAPVIDFPGDLRTLAAEGKAERLRLGHISEWTAEYEARMERELAMIAEKRYDSYFIVVADLIRWAKTQMLVGPARGSSAGSLVCYLLRITEIDPLVHELLFERFIDVSRFDLPDIDIDFSDTKREGVFTYLADKYGAANVARIGNVNTLKPRSAIAEVAKRFGVHDGERFDVINSLVEYTSGDSRYGKGLEDTFTTTAAGKKFAEKHPAAAAAASEIEGHAWHTGVHAAGVIVCNLPVSDYCTVGVDGVAEIDKPDSEALGLLKIDALGLRTLGVIEDAGVVTADELYALKLDDPEVLRVFNDQRFSGVFQFEGQAMRGVAAEIDFQSFRQIDHVTALARPGPLGAGAAQHYISRAAGREPVTYRHPSMSAYLDKTLGVVLYQEQVMRICFELGRFNWATVSEIRKSMSGRKGKEYFDLRGGEFVEGALSLGIPEEDANVIWSEICTFGAWGMNASHTVSYGVISYWCAWMKRYHGLAYAAACLRSAKDDQQTLDVLREMAEEGVEYEAFDIEISDVNWSVQNGRLVGGFLNLEGFGPAKSAAAVEARNAGRLTTAERAKIAAAEVKFSDLNPLRTKYAALYRDPEAHGCRRGSRILSWDEFPESGDVLWIAKVVEKRPRDINEALSIAKRNGKRLGGPSAYVDFRLADDTGIPIIARIDRFDFEPMGRIALENLRVNEDVLLVRGRRIPNFSMVKIDRIKCLNRPEAMNETA